VGNSAPSRSDPSALCTPGAVARAPVAARLRMCRGRASASRPATRPSPARREFRGSRPPRSP